MNKLFMGERSTIGKLIIKIKIIGHMILGNKCIEMMT